MNRACKEHQPGPEAEAFSKALSQAWVYIEQIRSRVSAGGPNMQSVAKSASIGAKRDYLVDAAKQIRLALERDVNEDYEAAFNHYKNGVDLLLGGIQVESNKERREAVKRKVAQYLKRAEEIFNSHLQRALGNGFTTTEGYSSLRFRPIRNLSFPIENLRMCKVVGIIDKVQLVQDPCTGDTFVLKSLLKSHMERRGQQTIIPQGVPYMVKLLRYYVSEDSIFLRLQHVQGHICLTYFGQWPEVEPQFSNRALEEIYTAPEVCGITEVTEACDWWSFGALLYELLTGMSLSQNHPSGIHTHSRLHLPDTLSCAAASLLTELLQCDPGSRLGAGADGISKIKSHPFFRTIQWNQLL